MENVKVSKRPSISNDRFWKIRSAKYDKLFWTKDQGYIDELLKLSDLKKHHFALDVGTGTGIVANNIKEKVEHVVAIDISNDMLQKGDWEGISILKWDIGNALFKDHTFHRVIARMVFHHIMNNIDRAILRCYDLLKDKGKITIAEGVPPNDDLDTINWYTEMFKFKETRRTFTASMLIDLLDKNGFKNINLHEYFMENFSVSNWLLNSGLNKEIQSKILDMHIQAPNNIKAAYNMRITSDDCLIRSKNVIITGEKL